MQARKAFCETNYFNSFVHVSPATVRCRRWSVEWGGVQTAECEDNEDSRVFVGIVMCRVWRSAGCQVQSVKCKA